ncbi:hypothetical protein EYF80_043043 [Liparis tanakae]|uniref:Uncharacterized protein n=1 Tax=Liparis tanakae TaxID=230148 RepID=A0A4Z2FZJ6_9TELE|nr:hypothetical protein EYF80_043043 [Liparis tanakae]
MQRLADEHAFQLLVEALHAAAQSGDQSRQGSQGDGDGLSLRTQKQVQWNPGRVTEQTPVPSSRQFALICILTPCRKAAQSSCAEKQNYALRREKQKRRDTAASCCSAV